jgi:hypothetical protein
MTAKEAREKATKNAEIKNERILIQVRQAISSEVEKGSLSCTYQGAIPESVKEALKLEGYTIRYESHAMDSYYVIGW